MDSAIFLGASTSLAYVLGILSHALFSTWRNREEAVKTTATTSPVRDQEWSAYEQQLDPSFPRETPPPPPGWLSRE